MEVLSKEDTEKLFQQLLDNIKQLQQDIALLKRGQSEWVTQDDACKLTGRTRSWFEKHRALGTLPIAMQPRAEGSNRIYFKRTDCVAYAEQHGIIPPSSLTAHSEAA